MTSVARSRNERGRRRCSIQKSRRLRIPVQTDVAAYADDFRNATERNAAVLTRAAERGFGT